ncbi:MAG: peptidase [Bacillales bacterium]|nr:peptidase [Bacillales bacterium]
MLLYLVAVIIVLFDQITKYIVEKQMYLGESIPVIDNFLMITSHRNRGAAWGMLEGQFLLFYIVTVIVVVGLIYYVKKNNIDDRFTLITVGLLIGGALGNFIDRVIRKEVVDFIDVLIFSYDFPVFNIADSSLFIGVVLLVIQTIREEQLGEKA